MKIIIIGGSGLVGSRISEILSRKYTLINLSTKTGVDITNASSLDVIKNESDAKVVILFAAKADVDSCEKDRELSENGDAWKINVTGAQNVVDACKFTNKKLVYISTDFVFSGEDTPEEGYTEMDEPHPINWYAQTKYKAEEVVKNSGLPFIIARISYPYRKEFDDKLDFVRAIKNRLINNQPVAAVTDHIMTPTFIDDIASCIDVLIHNNKTGIYHVTGSKSLTPYDCALLIAEKFGLDKNLITKTTRAEYFAGKAERPFNITMNNEKIKKLGINMKTFEEGLESMMS